MTGFGLEQGDGRRLPTNEVRHYEISELRDRHHEIVRMVVLGLENTEISGLLGVTPQNISDVRNSTIARQQIAVLREARDAETSEISKEIRRTATGALFMLRETIDRTNKDLKADEEKLPSKLAIEVAQDMLDRGGWKPPAKGLVEHLHAHLTGDEIKQLKGGNHQEVEETAFAEVEEGEKI